MFIHYDLFVKFLHKLNLEVLVFVTVSFPCDQRTFDSFSRWPVNVDTLGNTVHSVLLVIITVLYSDVLLLLLPHNFFYKLMKLNKMIEYLFLKEFVRHIFSFVRLNVEFTKQFTS